MRLSKGIEKVEDFIILKSHLLKSKLAKVKSTKHRGKIGLISGALITLLLTQKGCEFDKNAKLVKTTDTENLNKIMQSAKKEVGPHLVFDPNNESEMINRIAEVYVDAAAKGLGDLTIEQWMDWYTVTNIDDISPADYYKLLDDTKTATTIMENYDFVNNALLEDAITATPETVIKIDKLIADKKSAQELSSFQSALAAYNVASDGNKKKLANDVNEYLYSEFVTSKHDTVTASSNLTRMKLLLATWELTNNHSFTVPSADISKIIYPSNNAKCDLASEASGISVWNDQKVVVRKTVEEKMDMMFKLMSGEDKTKQEARVILRSLEIEMAIQDLVNKMGIVKVANPDSEKAIIDSKPKTSSGNTITPSEKKHVVTNPSTGKKEIHLPATEDSKKPVLDQIAKENANEQLRAKGVQEGAQTGNQNGYADGAASKPFNDKPIIDLSKSDKIYSDAYTTYYKQYYAEGYQEGVKLAQGPINQTEQIIIDKQGIEELEEIMIENGQRDGYADGDANGYRDGYADEEYNDYVRVRHDDKNYVKAYTESYEQAYRKGYREGRKDRRELESQSTTNKSNDRNKIDDDYFKEKTQNNRDGSKTIEKIELLPGFYEKDGKIYDENGNEVEIIGSNKTNQNIAALKTLRSVLSNTMNNANDINLDKTRMI